MPLHLRCARATLALAVSAPLLVATPAASASAFDARAAVASDTLTADQARRDLDILRAALEEAHGGLYRFVTKRELDARFDALRAGLSAPVTRAAFYEQLLAVLALVRDGHMRPDYDDSTVAALGRARLLPLGVVLEAHRVVVVSNDTPADTVVRPGMELLAVNGHRAGDLVARFLPLISSDGFSATRQPARLGRLFAQHYWMFVDRTGRFELTVRDADGLVRTTTVDGITNAERTHVNNPVNATMRANAARLRGPGENVSLRWVQAPAVAVVRVRAFDGTRYPTELDSVFRLIRDGGARSVILDLRGNGGGVDLYGAQLVGEFMDRPFRYFDRIHLATIRPSFATWKASTFDDVRNGAVPDPAGGYLVTTARHRGVAEQLPGPVPFTGRLVVLLDGDTFSTAADVVAVLRSHNRATFVGEESGGAYEGNTSGLNAQVVLPASGLKLRIQMDQYWNAVTPVPGGRGTLPDYPVATRVADILRGVDPQMEKALELARRP